MAKWWETLGQGLPELGTTLAWGRENRRKKREETKTIPNPYAGGPPIEVTADQYDKLVAGQPAAGLGYNRVPFIKAQDLPLAKAAADVEYLTKGTVGGVRPPADVAMENAAKAAAAENAGRFGFGARTMYTPAGETGFKPIPKLEGLRLTEPGQVYGPETLPPGTFGLPKEVLLGTTAPITQRTMTPEEILNQKIAMILAGGEETRKNLATKRAGGGGGGGSFKTKFLDAASADYNRVMTENPNMTPEQKTAADEKFKADWGIKSERDFRGVIGKAFEKKGGGLATTTAETARKTRAAKFDESFTRWFKNGMPRDDAKAMAYKESGASPLDLTE